MARVAVILAEGFEEIEAVSIIDVLRRADIEVVSLSLVDQLYVRGAHAITIACDQSIHALGEASWDMVILPGGWDGTRLLAKDPNAIALLRSIDQNGGRIGAICAAPFALEAAGVLKEGYTCYPSIETQMQTRGWCDTPIVRSDNIITARGPGNAICFALAIVHDLMGPEMAQRIRGALLADTCEE